MGFYSRKMVESARDALTSFFSTFTDGRRLSIAVCSYCRQFVSFREMSDIERRVFIDDSFEAVGERQRPAPINNDMPLTDILAGMDERLAGVQNSKRPAIAMSAFHIQFPNESTSAIAGEMDMLDSFDGDWIRTDIDYTHYPEGADKKDIDRYISMNNRILSEMGLDIIPDVRTEHGFREKGMGYVSAENGAVSITMAGDDIVCIATMGLDARTDKFTVLMTPLFSYASTNDDLLIYEVQDRLDRTSRDLLPRLHAGYTFYPESGMVSMMAGSIDREKLRMSVLALFYEVYRTMEVHDEMIESIGEYIDGL